MPRERVTMRKTREILRLIWSCGQSRRDTARTILLLIYSLGTKEIQCEAMVDRESGAPGLGL